MMVNEHDADRFDRSKRIDWMDMDRIHTSRCLVVGAGALGNEVVKCLVLSGFRDIRVVDMDHVVPSNLNRCVLFRRSDAGRMKSDAVAERALDLDNDVKITPISGMIQDISDWETYDVVLGCLDNISARLHTNSHAYFHKIPYVDGGTDGFRGKVQVVLPGGPCLQCSMNRSHMKILEERFSCTGKDIHLYRPKMAAEITTTSIIAAMQVREAIKIISGRMDKCIKNVVYYDGMSGEMTSLEVGTESSCPNHGGV